jgi:hypothetical protein
MIRMRLRNGLAYPTTDRDKSTAVDEDAAWGRNYEDLLAAPDGVQGVAYTTGVRVPSAGSTTVCCCCLLCQSRTFTVQRSAANMCRSVLHPVPTS